MTTIRSVCLGLLLLASGAMAQVPTLCITADRALLGHGKVVEHAQVFVAKGKIVSLSSGIKIPAGCEVISLKGCTLTPGLIDAVSHSPLVRGSASNEEKSEITPNYRVSRILDPSIPAFRRLRHLGVTTIGVHPGVRNVIAGRVCAVKTRGEMRSDLLLRDDLGIGITLGLDAARGNTSARWGMPGMMTRIPNSRMGTVVLVRKAFTEASEARARGGEIGADHQALIDLMDGKVTAFWKAPESKDILTAQRLAQSFGIKRNVIVGAWGAHKVAADLKEWGASVLLGRMGHRRQMVREFSLAGAAQLEKTGVLFAFSNGSTVLGSRLRDQALFGERGGLPAAEALDSITSRAARILGVADRVGSLEKGKDADIVAWTGDPLSPASSVACVIIDGVVVHRPGELQK